MAIVPLVLLAAFGVVADAKPVDGAADAVTLRDGKVVLGQVVDPAPRNGLNMLVRRAWAEAEVPEWAKRWETVESATLKRARAQRRGRLEAWRRERGARVGADDVIIAWIDRELKALGDPEGSTAPPLLVVKLSKADVRAVSRRPKAAGRMLRLAWLSKFKSPETMALDDLRGALEGRGFSSTAHAPVSVDELLPTPVESETVWSNRRAATEIANDSGLKYVRAGTLLLPEPEPGQPLELGSAVAVLGDLADALGGKPVDPLTNALGQIAARGRTGAVVTQLELSPDLSAVRVESVLWVHRNGRWGPAGSRQSTARPDQLDARAGDPLADDPQVKRIFEIVESLGLLRIPDDAKRRSLNMGAATRKALGQVRSAVLDDFAGLAFPVREQPAAAKP